VAEVVDGGTVTVTVGMTAPVGSTGSRSTTRIATATIPTADTAIAAMATIVAT
jgi:hypothetical protein